MEEKRMNPICIKHNAEVKNLDSIGNMCEDCLIDVAMQSAQNMGAADHFYCGYCGLKCTPEEIVGHLTYKKCHLELVGK